MADYSERDAERNAERQADYDGSVKGQMVDSWNDLIDFGFDISIVKDGKDGMPQNISTLGKKRTQLLVAPIRNDTRIGYYVDGRLVDKYIIHSGETSAEFQENNPDLMDADPILEAMFMAKDQIKNRDSAFARGTSHVGYKKNYKIGC